MARRQSTSVRRQQIAGAALDVIAARGVGGLSVAAVAARLDLVPSALYRHFPSKDAMIHAVLELIRDRLLANVQAVSEESPDALDRLRRLMGRHMQLFQSSRGILRLILSEDVANGRADLRGRLHQVLSAYLQAVSDVVEQGRRQGQLRPDVEPLTAALMFLGLIQPPMILWHISGGRFDVAAHAKKAWPLFSRAVASAKVAGRKPGRPGQRMKDRVAIGVDYRGKRA